MRFYLVPRVEVFFISFFVSLIISFAITPLVLKIAKKLKVYDYPDFRKIHGKPVPYLGGIAIYLGFFAGAFIALLLGIKFGLFGGNFLTRQSYLILRALLAGGTLILLVGLLDDIKPISAKIKFIFQIIIAVILFASGIRIDFLSHPTQGIVYLPLWMSFAITIFWLVGITNAINLLDGLDGLLAGVCFISAIIFSLVAALKGQFLVAILMLALSGASLGFLKYNFYPARIFLGDAGSLFIGLVFASLTIVGAFKGTAFLALFIPICIMGLPIIDTSFAILRRLFTRQPIFKPDKGHIHHRLLNLGLPQKKVVFIIYIISLILGLIALYLAYLTRL